MIDAVFINPNSSKFAYQKLADKYAAIEPPTWALLLAESCRSKGFKVAIIDCDAEKLSNLQAIQRIKDLNPRYSVFTVYGQNPSFKQIYYEYDQNGRVLSTVDSQNRKQLFFYKQNGLLNNVFTYNGNGALEVEFLFNYTYHE